MHMDLQKTRIINDLLNTVASFVYHLDLITSRLRMRQKMECVVVMERVHTR